MADARITFYYAIIDESGWCYEMRSTSRNCNGLEGYIPIASLEVDYLDKYYNVADGNWYFDEGFTQLFEDGNV